MKYRNTHADELIREMEDIVSKDELSCEDEEKLGELYCEVKGSLERDPDEGSMEHQSLQRRFKNVCEQLETPDDILSQETDSMFPDIDSMKGFGWKFRITLKTIQSLANLITKLE